jgi:phenylacetate-coenzyme A ligase PaaK-like adenylate-forming protein
MLSQAKSLLRVLAMKNSPTPPIYYARQTGGTTGPPTSPALTRWREVDPQYADQICRITGGVELEKMTDLKMVD